MKTEELKNKHDIFHVSLLSFRWSILQKFNTDCVVICCNCIAAFFFFLFAVAFRPSMLKSTIKKGQNEQLTQINEPPNINYGVSK